MKLPRFTRTLHFRMSALFLVLLSLAMGGYYLWINATVFSAYKNAEEKAWYEKQAEPQLEALAAGLAPVLADAVPDTLAAVRRLQDFQAGVRQYGVELIVFDSAGRHLAASADSLRRAVPALDPDLLAKMTAQDWDFSSYPLPHDVDAYENRIFQVESLQNRPAPMFLVASYEPVTMGVEEMNADWRHLGIQALVLIMIYAAVTALVVMAWASRRIRTLSRGVSVFADGRFDHRVPDRSADEIGALGRHFNAMARRIQAMMDELGAKEQFQRQLIANVSHDLRTPLASLRGYVETLSYDPANLSTQEKRHYLSVISSNLDHLDRLIEHTLILSRLDSGQAVLRLEEFPPAELADAVLQRCAGIAERAGVTLHLAADRSSGLVRADALQIGQVLQNLIENGVKFNRPGGSVTVAVAQSGDRVRIGVTDSGTGIAPEDLPHIFERFYTGNKSRTRAEGKAPAADEGGHLQQSSGLGLAIAAKIVEAHGGVLEVATEPGRGATFQFTLPCAAEPDSPPQQKRQPA